MLGISHNSTLLRHPKVLLDRQVASGRGTKTVKCAVSSHHATQHKHQNVFYTNSFKSVPTNLFRNNGSRYSGNIEQKSFTKLKSATLKITIAIHSDGEPQDGWCKLAPVPYWFDRIEIRTANGSKHLGIVRNDQLMFNLNLIDQNKLAGVLRNCNMDSDWSPHKEYRAGDVVSFYLPLIGTYLGLEHYFANLQGDIVLDFVPANGIITSAGAVSIDCNDLSLIVETENLTAEDEKSHQVYHSQVITSNRVLDWTPINEYSKTLTANAVSTIDLDSVIGKCAGFVVIVRETGATNTGNKLFEYVDLGDTAQLDVITNGGKSILGSGVPLDAKYLRDEIWATHFSTNFNRRKNIYFLPFTSDGKNAIHGVVDGLIELSSSGHKIQIKPAPVGTSATQLVIPSDAPTTGKYRLSFRGSITPCLDYDASPTSIKAQLEALPTFRHYEGKALTVSVANSMDAPSTGITLTFPSGVAVEDKVYVLSEGLRKAEGSPVSVNTSNELSEHGRVVSSKSGFTTGAYDISAYALVYVNTHTQGGKITTELL